MTTTLTNDQITAGAAVLCDHGQPIGRNAAIEVFDAMQAGAADYTVDDSELARKIMLFLGQRTSGSMEPGADPLRDRLAERIALWRPAPSPQVADIAVWDYDLMGVPNEEVAALWRSCGHSGTPPYSFANRLWEKLRDAIAASRRAVGDAIVPSFDCSLAAVDAYDPQSFINGAKWAQEKLLAAPASAGQAAPAPEGLRQAVYMALHYYMSVQEPNEWEATDAAIEALQKYLAAQPAEGAGQAGQVADAALERAAKIAENFGPSRPIATPRPSEIIKGRWEGEQAASSTIAALIRGCKYAPTERAAAPADLTSAQVKP